MAKIAFEGITKQFHGTSKPAVDAVTFEGPEGKTCMLVGTSGSGKTTLLRVKLSSMVKTCLRKIQSSCGGASDMSSSRSDYFRI